MLLDGLALLRPRRELCCAVWMLFRMLVVFGDWLASWADVAYRRLAPEHLRFLQVVAWSPQNWIPIGASRNRNFGWHLALLPFSKWTMYLDGLSCFCLLLAELLNSSMHEFIYSWTIVCLAPCALKWFLSPHSLGGTPNSRELYDPLCIPTRCKGVWTTFLCRCDLFA